MIDGVVNSDAIPVLERLVQFSGQRHRLIVNNIANLDTPFYRPVDVSPTEFQQQLGQAIDERRDAFGNAGGQLRMADTDQISFTPHAVQLHPDAAGDNILFHDQNDRSVERIMQSLVENFMVFRSAADILKSRFDLINSAISERP